MKAKINFTRAQWAWAFSDWANSAYTTTIIAVFFPIFFKQYWGSTLSPSESTFYLGLSNSANSLIIFMAAPFLGALADVSGRKKPFLFTMTAISVLTLVPLFFVHQGNWQLALIFYTLSNIGYWGANIFHDALIMDVTDEKNISLVSSFAYSMGYLGGGVLIVLNAWAVQSPAAFGLASAAEAVQWSFLSVAVWWVFFSIPLYLFVHERTGQTEPISARRVVQNTFSTLQRMSRHRRLFLFLLGYIFYIDGVNTVIKMAVDFALNIGLSSSDLITAIILVQFVGFPATLFYAWLAQRTSELASIFVGLSIYTLVTIASVFITTAKEFYLLAVLIGLAQGGLQAISRSYFGRMTPRESAGEFFGVYNMVGKFSAILGPLFVGTVSLLTGNPRYSLLVVLIFFAAGGTLVFFSSRIPNRELGRNRS